MVAKSAPLDAPEAPNLEKMAFEAPPPIVAPVPKAAAIAAGVLGVVDAIWDVTVFTKNRERFLNGDITEKFFGSVLEQARAAGYLSEEHFTVDGTLIEAWATHKSFKPKDEASVRIGGCIKVKNPDVDFRGRERSNDSHASTTDPDARLYKKS